MRPSAAKPTLSRPWKPARPEPNRVFLVPRHAHHHGPADLARHMRGDRHLRIRRALGAEAAAAIFGDVDEVLRLHPAVTGKPRHHERLALRGAEHVDLAVLPVGHGRAGLHAMMALRANDEAFVEHQLGFLEAGLEIAVVSIRSAGLPIGRLPSPASAKSRAVHLMVWNLTLRVGDVAVETRRRAGPDAGSPADRPRTAAAHNRS